jgi:hypothetical protein
LLDASGAERPLAVVGPRPFINDSKEDGGLQSVSRCVSSSLLELVNEESAWELVLTAHPPDLPVWVAMFCANGGVGCPS